MAKTTKKVTKKVTRKAAKTVKKAAPKKADSSVKDAQIKKLQARIKQLEAKLAKMSPEGKKTTGKLLTKYNKMQREIDLKIKEHVITELKNNQLKFIAQQTGSSAAAKKEYEKGKKMIKLLRKFGGKFETDTFEDGGQKVTQQILTFKAS